MTKDNIWQSKRFWVMIVDLVVSSTLYFVTKYSNPALISDVTFVIGVLQPVVLAVIGAYTYQDVQAQKNITS